MSRLLVFGQFSMIALLVFGGSWALAWWAWIILALGIAILVWAGLSLGNMNLTVMPDPRDTNQISTQGIYSYLRHPMYTSVLLCGIAVSFGAPSTLRWIALAVCLLVLVLKIKREEHLLTARHPEYPVRMKGVARLCPGIW